MRQHPFTNKKTEQVQKDFRLFRLLGFLYQNLNFAPKVFVRTDAMPAFM